ncbi:sensor histidine kinase [Neptunitalea lumnitzerae]|uniref:histidine kinase n=1 Tax=Neptunitalea lumnitzerae TaxID=2965509 RepID=A0ABQ5MIC1_9FLAO|nr:ATP-binding protein [Neptunitalea sp. Y10]GLB49176.1 hypothetical protein Y10_15440 [Neptunitalea sp. Y10]
MKDTTSTLTDKFRETPKIFDEIEDYAIILLDVNGNIINWNRGAERIKGYSAYEILGKNFRQFYTQKDLDFGKPDMLIEKARNEGKAIDEGWRIKKDGSAFWGSVTITARHNDLGEVIGFIKVTRDLTERKRAEEALLKHTREIEIKNKELEQYTYIASHDLQEPIRTVINFVELLNSEYEEKLDENAKLYMSFISEASHRMSNLVKGLLDFTRIGNTKQLVTVNCNKLVESLLQDLEVKISESKAEIIVGDLPEIKAYEPELISLFLNLITNAIKFRKNDVTPKIKITSKLEKDGWHFSVKDNGIGIKERYLSKIFVMFQRLHSRSEFDGTGIGLAYCKKIVDLHNGRIWVESEFGNGSNFFFSLGAK